MLAKLVTTVDGDNPVEGDLALDGGKHVYLGADGFDGAEYAQRLRSRLRFFKGEWFLGANEGVPYFEEILEKGVDDGRVAAILQQVILSTPGFVSIEAFDLQHDRAARKISIVFVARLDSGHVFTSADFGEFLIDTLQEGDNG